MRFALFFLHFMLAITAFSQQIALLKYNGGGDWYANPTSLPNLVQFCNAQINTRIEKNIPTVEANSTALFSYPFVHMTGHGNVSFSDADMKNLRKYLENGGFLHIDDNYGMDVYIRNEIAKIFPNQPLVELGKNHPIFQAPFSFPNGLPKIHEHDGKPAQAFAIIIKNRIVLLYTYETDLGDGWENPEIHNNPENVRKTALQMGANIINYAFSN
ncbi:DUF4159 domain-containing protein [Flavobacterium agricola]|uniref:DUF4159 domain-containing protein n=1 Tax=Flavobacterium agricola TaxID=2870839 RepID=A0ABY6M0I9_9FLAO|nr:DUF4159 domain-containing protein [Flavobacterium agricola]UYW02074.1 DUF4159 domain-containing protein [Flavobacterium agricola]